MPSTNAKTHIFSYLAILAVVAIAGVLAYSLWITLNSGAQDKGVVTCSTPNSCFWTSHWHVFVPIEICGEKFRLPIEKGPLEKSHTHEEENIWHWHDKLPYDNQAKTVLNTEPLKLGGFFDALEIPFDSTQINGKQNGDACPNGETGTLKMLLNGKNSTLFRDYILKDKDVVRLVFDSRTPQELENAAAQSPIVFPTLGRG